ncbi:MAG: PKD domain-containing protein [Candidatus Bipolaricaulota bacterium]|nr:PKD domain-containing protein [Candidatus Bipolaricaulota bacterium]
MMRRTAAVVAFLIAASAVPAVAPDASWAAVRLNEVCWGGSALDPTAEWIELANATTRAVDLDGWRLVSSDGSPDVLLSGTLLPTDPAIPEEGYFLLERDSDDTVPDVAADLIYRGALNDRGEILFLYDPLGRLADTANAVPDSSGVPPWAAGTNAYGVPPYRSMERIDGRLDDAPGSWATCPTLLDGVPELGAGTPRRANRASSFPKSVLFRIDPPSPQPGKVAVFDATESADGAGRIETYVWDFGDGTAEAGAAMTTHVYARPGHYPVSLTARDNRGAAAYAERWILVEESRPPIADFSVVSAPGRREPTTLDHLRFQDESSDEESEVIAWAWEFGDGSSAAEQHPDHIYLRPGTYVVSLAVEDAQGDRALQTQSLVITNRPPIGAFSFSNLSPSQGETVVLDASASVDEDGAIVSYAWDLDADGVSDLNASSSTVEYVCRQGGELVASLTVTDDGGDPSLAVTGSIYVNFTPVAQFTASSFAVAEGEAIRFSDCSYDPDGATCEWLWDFGDGVTDSSPSAAHAYDTDGAYTVSLSVLDDAAASGTTAVSISVSNLPPRAAISANVLERETGETLTFDASASNDPSPWGRITTYEWDYDADGTYDESTTSPAVHHAYDEDGTFAVRVRVTDDDGAAWVSDRIRVTVRNRPPTLGTVTPSPRSATDEDEVALSAAVVDPDGAVVRWEWTFGDGTTSSEAAPRHRFPDDGSFLVSVVVVDDDGSRSEPVSFTIDIANAAPEATWNDARAEGCPRGILFDASASYDPSPTGAIVHVAWDFGDGTTCPGTEGSSGGDRLRPVHCYALPGPYIVTLILLDEEGAIGRFSRQIVVLN